MTEQKSFVQLRDLLPKALEHYNVAAPVYAANVVNRWYGVLHSVTGIMDPAATHALHLKNGILTIAVSHSAIAQTIQMHKLSLLEQLNQQSPKALIEDIRCTQNS